MLRVLSLFDGISCGQVALQRAGIKVDEYYASEIDKYAIQITQKNFPNTIQLGDVTKWKEWDIDWKNIDLLFAGFPCQSWSVAGKQGGDKDPRGQLMYDMLDIKKHIEKENPNLIFLFENVKMKKEFQSYIDNLIGVEPILINSSLLSAQNRLRNYWTNIPNVTQPEDKGILLKDILEDITDNLRPCKTKEYNKDSLCHHIANATDINGNETIKRVYASSAKAPTLTTMQGGHREPKVFVNREKSYCIDANYHKGGNPKSYFEKGRRQLIFFVGRGNNPSGFRALDGKVPCLTKNSWEHNNFLVDIVGYRKLTPLECERLQTIDDNYTAGVSNSQRYKAIGNGWTVDVIAHILKGLSLCK